ncbi:BafA family autotransporter [Bartonella bovis]|uniref:Pertactin family virulence factor/autotransporter n=1 Tax=Bartonella bovis m02 TaxID=1094492 RepID=N6VQV2_9HYPH|nr:BafA family autotransporter [Bartonella bovis]ENN93452.1 pertactin family virulence factor/autotransporter [Bartonella bovis m02]
MQHKYKLSFSILLISSSFLIQDVNAREKITENVDELLKSLVINNGRRQRGTRTAWGISQNTEIEKGAVKIVRYGSSVNTTVNTGGKQIVMGGATAIDTKIKGGKQFVLGNSDYQSRSSSAYSSVISGENGIWGQQNVYDNGQAWATKIMQEGEQNIYKVQTEKGGTASGTEVSKNGRQNVLTGGEANGVTLKEQALQIVYWGGVVKDLTINSSANSWVHTGATLRGKTVVNDGGHLHLYAADPKNHITKENITISGQQSTPLFSIDTWSDKNNSQVNIENLSGNGTVNFDSVGYDSHHLHLHVENLSGSLHFQFNVNNVGSRGDYLFIEKGEGDHKISVIDSGVEITQFLSRTHDLLTKLSLITDKSGKANFTLVGRSGKNISTFDGGTYMYGLQSEGSKKNGKIWYLSANVFGSKYQSRSRRDLYQKYLIANPSTDPSAENQTTEPKPRRRAPRHLSQHEPEVRMFSSEDSQFSDLSTTTPSAEDQIAQSKSRKRSRRHVNQHEPNVSVFNSENPQVSTISTAPSMEDQTTEPKSRRRSSRHVSQRELDVPMVSIENSQTSNFLTTPSTDAVLSLAVAPELVFNNEVQSLRAGRGILDRNTENLAFWTYMIKSKERIATGHTHFKLDQAGIMLGTDRVIQLLYGKLYIGGFGSYDQAHITHARRGVSGVDTYSFGTYATYLTEYGWYLDGILKYNHYQNHLKAVSTSGLAIQGNYNQWAIGTSFEGGYRFQTGQSTWVRPYSQFTWLQVKGKEIQLSNGMTGDISSSTSLRSEVGLSIRHTFNFNTNASFMGYITAAWLREYIDNNHTTINKLHKFITDLSDNAGKLAIGLNSFISKNLTFYTEAQYLKGHKMTQSLQGILGIRYSF